MKSRQIYQYDGNGWKDTQYHEFTKQSIWYKIKVYFKSKYRISTLPFNPHYPNVKYAVEERVGIVWLNENYFCDFKEAEEFIANKIAHSKKRKESKQKLERYYFPNEKC